MKNGQEISMSAYLELGTLNLEEEKEGDFLVFTWYKLQWFEHSYYLFKNIC